LSINPISVTSGDTVRDVRGKYYQHYICTNWHTCTCTHREYSIKYTEIHED